MFVFQSLRNPAAKFLMARKRSSQSSKLYQRKNSSIVKHFSNSAFERKNFLRLVWRVLDRVNLSITTTSPFSIRIRNSRDKFSNEKKFSMSLIVAIEPFLSSSLTSSLNLSIRFKFPPFSELLKSSYFGKVVALRISPIVSYFSYGNIAFATSSTSQDFANLP